MPYDPTKDDPDFGIQLPGIQKGPGKLKRGSTVKTTHKAPTGLKKPKKRK